MPPSLNSMYRSANRGGRTLFFKTKEAKQYQLEVDVELAFVEPVVGPVKLEIWCYFQNSRSDIDGRLKSLLDVLQGNLYENDNQILDLVVHKRIDKENPRVEVQVEPA